MKKKKTLEVQQMNLKDTVNWEKPYMKKYLLHYYIHIR